MKHVFGGLCVAAALTLAVSAHAANVDFSLYGDYELTPGYLTGTFFGLADSGPSLPTRVYLTVYPYHSEFTPFSEDISGLDFATSGLFDLENGQLNVDFSFLDLANDDDLTIKYSPQGEQSFSGDFQGQSIYSLPDDGTHLTGYLEMSVSSAPEPSAWMLLITGLAMLGGLLRRRPRGDPETA